MLDRGGDIGHRIVPVEFPLGFPASGDTRLVEAENDALLDPVEQGRRDCVIALLGEIIDGLADVVVDAENFLNDHHPGPRRSLRLGGVGVEAVAVGCGER